MRYRHGKQWYKKQEGGLELPAGVVINASAFLTIVLLRDVRGRGIFLPGLSTDHK